MSNPIEELGKSFDDHFKKIVGGNQTLSVELGTINEDFSLTVGSLGNPIPKGDYMIPLRFTLLEEKMEIESSEEELRTNKKLTADHLHGIDPHLHIVKLPEELRPLRAGDRVLVAWCGTEPVVIDIVKSS